MAAAIPQQQPISPPPPPLPPPPLPVMPWPVLIKWYSGPVIMYPVMACPAPPPIMAIPHDVTNQQPVGLPLDQVETTGESRDEPSATSNEKSTQTKQPCVDEGCLSDEEPSNADADVSMNDADKSLRNSSTNPSDSKGLQDQAEENQEVEKESKGCDQEDDPGPTAQQPETSRSPQKQVERNDGKKLSADADSKKIQSSATKRLITVEGKTYFVSRGMEKKFGFERKEQAVR